MIWPLSISRRGPRDARLRDRYGTTCCLPRVAAAFILAGCNALWVWQVAPASGQDRLDRRFALQAEPAQVAPEPLDLTPQPAYPDDTRSPYDPFPAEPPDARHPTAAAGDPQRSESPAPLPSPELDAEPTPATAPGADTMPRQVAGAIVDPTPMLRTINEELSAAALRESDQFGMLRQGLHQLRQATENMRLRAEQNQRQLEAERRRARRAEQLAEDARQQAEQARHAAEETWQRFQELRPVAPPPGDVASNAPTPADAPASTEEGHELGPVPAHGTAAPAPEIRSAPPPPAPSILTAAVPITDESVDRESLANNLFGAREYRLALPIYLELIKSATETEDELWYQYQAACCYRNLRSLPQAEKFYRIVAGHKDSYLAAMARWYLSLIQEQNSLRQQVTDWESVLGRSIDKHTGQELIQR